MPSLLLLLLPLMYVGPLGSYPVPGWYLWDRSYDVLCSSSVRISYALEIFAKRVGSPPLSGWWSNASVRYAFLISAVEQPLLQVRPKS